MVTKKIRITGYGIGVITYPETYKGRKITPSLYKVRLNSKGNPVATVGLYYQKNGRKTLWKNKILRA